MLVVLKPCIEGGPLASNKWSYNTYKWPYKWITGVITPISGVITLLITGRGPSCMGGLVVIHGDLNPWFT